MKTIVKNPAKSTAFIFAAGIFSFGFAAASGKAHGADLPQHITKTVVYGDLNLDSEQGAKVLYSRLRGAARDVCQPLESRNLLGNLWWRCFNDSLGSAVARVNTARVTALHNRTVSHVAKS